MVWAWISTVTSFVAASCCFCRGCDRRRRRRVCCSWRRKVPAMFFIRDKGSGARGRRLKSEAAETREAPCCTTLCMDYHSNSSDLFSKFPASRDDGSTPDQSNWSRRVDCSSAGGRAMLRCILPDSADGRNCDVCKISTISIGCFLSRPLRPRRIIHCRFWRSAE